MSFITAGDPSKAAVLLLHGFPGSVRYFREVVPELSRAAYVIAPDLPAEGDGRTSPRCFWCGSLFGSHEVIAVGE